MVCVSSFVFFLPPQLESKLPRAGSSIALSKENSREQLSRTGLCLQIAGYLGLPHPFAIFQ